MKQNSPSPKKSLGQHWLNDVEALKAMCEAAEVSAGDVVLEIGPGTGSLTDVLLANKAEVLALEYDVELYEKLTEKYDDLPASEIFIQEGDIRTFDFDNMSDVYKIVANIPYYLTSFLLRRLTESKTHKPAIASLLLQKEVAERLAAEPGSLSIIAVTAQFYYEVSLGRTISAQLFTPPPKVNSRILILKRRAQPLFDVDTKKFFHIVKAGFGQKRKTLENSLSAGLAISKIQSKELLESAGIAPTARAQTLSLADWHKLYKSF